VANLHLQIGFARTAFVMTRFSHGEVKASLNMDLSSTKPRILLADDSQRVIEAISMLLSEEFEVVGSVHDGTEAIKAAIRLKPDVLVMDIVMPKQDGIQAARRLHQMNCPTKIVLLTGMEDQDYVEASLAAGASGFVFKCRAALDLSRAVHEVLAGRVFVSTRSRAER
jgi:two-component system response regulator DegU